jgi:peptidoglycan/LPS O-acetylase OafA/YrhL
MSNSSLHTPIQQTTGTMHADDLRQAIHSHMPQLDALRGIAILWVIFHNAARDGTGDARNLVMGVVDLFANMGWAGVQLFFVLSGFLITGILLDGRGATNQFRNFYARRTLRIFPVYYAFLLLAFVILPWAGLITWSDTIHLERVWDWTYLVNWVLPFDKDASFPHLWSLAVEEQYYLLWPLFVVFLRERTLAYVCLALVISAILSRAFLVFHYDTEFANHAMYFFTFARWDTLAIGSLLALLVRSDTAVPYLQRYFTPTFVALSIALLLQISVERNFSQYSVVASSIRQRVQSGLPC